MAIQTVVDTMTLEIDNCVVATSPPGGRRSRPAKAESKQRRAAWPRPYS